MYFYSLLYPSPLKILKLKKTHTQKDKRKQDQKVRVL